MIFKFSVSAAYNQLFSDLNYLVLIYSSFYECVDGVIHHYGVFEGKFEKIYMGHLFSPYEHIVKMEVKKKIFFISFPNLLSMIPYH